MKYVELSRDAGLLNLVVNDPSVFPHVCIGCTGPFDLSDLLADERNLFFATEHGGFLVLDQGDGVYEIHSQFLPDGRGRKALVAGREAMDYMFTQMPCRVLMTYCPAGNIGAVSLSKAVGMNKTDDCMRLGVAMSVYAISREEWLCRQQSR